MKEAAGKLAERAGHKIDSLPPPTEQKPHPRRSRNQRITRNMIKDDTKHLGWFNYIRICCFWSVPFPLDVFITQLHNILEKKTKQEHVVDQDGFPECFRI